MCVYISTIFLARHLYTTGCVRHPWKESELEAGAESLEVLYRYRSKECLIYIYLLGFSFLIRYYTI